MISQKHCMHVHTPGKTDCHILNPAINFVHLKLLNSIKIYIPIYLED